MKITKTTGARIRQLRVNTGWTLIRLATESGLSKQTIIDVELDRVSPTIATLEKIAGALSTTAADLIRKDAA